MSGSLSSSDYNKKALIAILIEESEFRARNPVGVVDMHMSPKEWRDMIINRVEKDTEFSKLSRKELVDKVKLVKGNKNWGSFSVWYYSI
jgi:hypothetical protein